MYRTVGIITPLAQEQVLVDEASPEISTKSNDITVPDIVEAPQPQPTEKEETTATAVQSQITTTKPPAPSNSNLTTPQMGDTRVVNGQKQVFFLGFGWIEDCDEPNEGVYAEDMYENGNKIGNMDGATIGDSDGDIDKMVGTMGD